MRILKTAFLLILASAMAFSLSACSGKSNQFIILSGSENDTLEPIIEQFEKENHVDIEMQYKGSVDIMLELQKDTVDYDAVWPANSLWISLGDKKHAVKHINSIMTSPVVFGIRKSLAEELGFVGKQVSVKDILKAITGGKLKFMMTSASQSNSGASAYIGFLYALLGNPETITMDDLHRPQLKEDIRQLLSGINRSSGSSGWLKDLFLQGNYDAMVNYESIIIETNNELIRSGKEPLYLVYPYDGLVIADSPLGYVNKGNSKREETFMKLQAYLLSEKVQEQILKLGRRTGIGGVLEKADDTVFNPDWGIDTKRILSPIRLPSAEVIQEALYLYQSEFKKPSYTVFCLDFSGSMAGDGEDRMKEAMKMLLDRDISRKYFLNPSPEDVIIVVPFSGEVIDIWEARGGDRDDMNRLIANIEELGPRGSTDIYSPVVEALNKIKAENPEGYIVSVVLMTDGRSNTGMNYYDLETAWSTMGRDIPVFSILFGEASEDQLEQIVGLTRARIFDGKKDLVGAFKSVRGYN